MTDPKAWALLDMIADQVQSVLQEAKIYDVTSLGWANAYDPDPELIGHAMWQLDQPSLNLNELIGEEPVSQRPQEMDKLVATLGEDFYGLMQMSRLAIGFALLWRCKARKEPYDNNLFFWLHHTDAFVKLAMASDRLRDLLIVACTRSSPKLYGKSGKRNRLYVTPFQEAEGLLVARGHQDSRFSESVQFLPALGDHLYAYVSRRHQIVHEIATDVGKQTWHNFTELQERYDREKESGFSPKLWDVIVMAGDEQAHEINGDVDCASDDVQAWYKLLIKGSHHIFQIEYWSRKLRTGLADT